MDHLCAPSVDLPDHAHAQLPDTLSLASQVAGLEYEHVAAVPAAPLQIAPGGRPLLRRRDDLEEAIPDRHDGVYQAKGHHVRIVVRDLDTQNATQVLDASLELTGHQCYLS